MNNTEKLQKWAIDKIEKEYKDDIALLISIEGHSTDGDGHGECFDYFLPCTQKGYELTLSFIVDGIGHDLYPRSWERVEKSAMLNDMPICLANATIVYAKSDEDRKRFLTLQKKLEDNLKDRSYVYKKAVECLDDATDIYGTMLFEENFSRIKMACGFIARCVTQAAAFLNGTFAQSSIYTKEQASNENPKTRMYHCPDMKETPDGFFEDSAILLHSNNAKELKDAVYNLIKNARCFADKKKPQDEKPQKDIDNYAYSQWYCELSLWFRRIRYFCEENMVPEAFNDACNMQSELLITANEFDTVAYDLLSSFDADDLSLLSQKASEIEKSIRSVLKERNTKILEFDGVDTFLREM